jgi:hypothetical protein
MDKVDRYRQILQKVIEDSAAMLSEGNEVAILPVCDSTHGQYLLISLGWQKVGRREHAIVFHAQLRGSQISVETDRTEEGIATFLTEAGVEKDDIELTWARRRPTDNPAAVAA